MIYIKETKLIDRNNDSIDYDLLLQVVFKKEYEDKIIYYVQDETDSCELHAYKYFNFLEIKDVLRVRNIRITEGNRYKILQININEIFLRIFFFNFE